MLTDCVPSKALIATADYMSDFEVAGRLGVRLQDEDGDEVTDALAEVATVNERILDLAAAQSSDIRGSLESVGVTVLRGTATIESRDLVRVETTEGEQVELPAHVVLVATGATPRVLPSAQPDGERILTWQQIYSLRELPEKIVVIGSGCHRGRAGPGLPRPRLRGRARQLPRAGAARRGRRRRDRHRGRLPQAGHGGAQHARGPRASSAPSNGVVVTLVDGRTVEATHALLAVGSVPQTAGLGLEDLGVVLTESGHIEVDRVSRTSVPGIYAAGDCTGVLPLASVAAMQGRIAMWHALGDAVAPLNVRGVAANIFTEPEIATVGISQGAADESRDVESVMLPLARNPRAKMQGITDGFVKLFCRTGFGTVLGGVVVAPKASELIHPVALAVQNRLSVDQVASTITVYPSLSGSIAEAARQLHQSD